MSSISSSINVKKGRLAKLVEENPVVIVATRECCMCIVVKSLMETLGFNPRVLKVEEAAVLEELWKIENDGSMELPAVYIGGEYLGGVDKVIENHIKGQLVPLLAGALWLSIN
ncbi:unnamed protein product [Withania somnifera]